MALADRLTVRLLVLMSIALLPLGMIAMMTTLSSIRAADSAAEQGLVGLTAQAVSGKRALIESAFASAAALTGVVVESRANLTECNAFLNQYVERSGLFSFAGFLDAAGDLTCRSDTGGDAVNLATNPGFVASMADPVPVVSASPFGPVSRSPVIVVSSPLLVDGETLGLVVVSLTTRSFELMHRAVERVQNAPETVVLFNQRGEIVSVTAPEESEAALPAGVALVDLSARAGDVFRGPNARGQNVLFSVSELLPGRLYAVGQWSKATPSGELLQTRILPLLLPVLMWLASLAVAFCAVYFLVIRQLRGLNRQMRRFALGQRDAWEEPPIDASAEFREINATFRRMARIIARDESERDEALAEKTVLLKEIHHRVKNNLQLIASIINLQIRDLTDESSRSVLQNVQNRVLSMASIHRSLYEENRLTELRADRVLGEIVQRLVSFGTSPAQKHQINCIFSPVTLSAERMVPLSLLLTEVLTNAIKHMSHATTPSARWIDVTLERDQNGECRLQVSNANGVGPDDDEGADPLHDPNTGIGADLINAFAAQMEARVTRVQVEGPRGPAWVITLYFKEDQDEDPEDQAGFGLHATS